MPPALKKTSEKDGLIHISSPLLTRDPDFSKELDPEINLTDDSYARSWLNLSSLSFLDSCGMKSSLDLPDLPLDHNSAFYKIDLQSSLESLLGCASMDESGADFPLLQDDSRFEEQTVVEEQSRNVLKEHQANLRQTLTPLQYIERESKLLSSGRSSRIINKSQSHALTPAWHSGSHISAQEEVDARRMRLASQQRALATRIDQAKLRLHALLGENTVQVLNEQLEVMRWRELSMMSTKPKTEPGSLSPAENTCANVSGVHEEPESFPNYSTQHTVLKLHDSGVEQRSCDLSASSKCLLIEKSSESVQFIKDVQSLTWCGRAVLHVAQQALDSDATESSSDDEWEEDTQGNRSSSGCLGCEWRFQSDKAKLASQWTWLKLRLSELDLQIQQVSKLHQHLHSNKIQQTLLTETADLMLTARHPHDLNSELDTEPSSPTRLLRNIERQSAQLSQIVNSLMAPLSDSPLHCPVAKRDSRCWRGSRKRLFNSTETDVFLHTGSTSTAKPGEKKRRRVCCRGQLPSQVDGIPGCARTRPLLTYHKPRLFAMDQSAVTQQGADSSSFRCSSFVSCDQTCVCSGPDYSNSTNKSSVPQSVHTAFFKQDWLQPSQPGSLLPPGLNPAGKHTPSIFNCTHKLQAAQMNSRATPSQKTPAQTCRRTGKRRHQRRADIDVGVSRVSMFSPSTEDSTDDILTPQFTSLHRRKSRFPSRWRNSESVYNINNIVVPMSLAAPGSVEKLQFKDIPTPSWRIVELSSLVQKEVEEDIDKVESLTDEVFVQRHQSYEHREKLSWSSWERGRRCTHRARLSSSTDVSSDCEPSSWTCNTPTNTPQHNAQEREPQSPWERRAFPLSDTAPETLRCDEDALKALWSNNKDRSDGRCRNTVSSLCYDHTSPPAGRTRNNRFRVTLTPTHTDPLHVHYRSRK
ncbi:KAT8 regulatory NSL complex subunit 1-like protein isoform 2-T2 [Clarias gariepinus]|uniref:KAT8 regulatory NSL complex subunit 1-like protein isoform X2 n=1 Tax=Clarias gariepinus TaxID=13013 RepID=UPI00234CD70E|nr:KAT8 regulatory NSL complex subunit 1-like protein isoform X2 [Clarias gariepinus]